MDLVVHAGSEGEAGAAVRGRFQRSLIRFSPLTFGYRLAAPTTPKSGLPDLGNHEQNSGQPEFWCRRGPLPTCGAMECA